MHFALVTHGLPQPSSNGGPMTCWAITQALLKAGHRVSIVSLSYPGDAFDTQERRDAISALGADLARVDTSVAPTLPAGAPRSFSHRIRRSARSLLRPDLSDFFPTVHLAPRMQRELERIGPDAAFVYHWDTLASVHGLDKFPRMAGVGDPWHLPSLRRWQAARPRPALSYLIWTLYTFRDFVHCPKSMVKLLNECEACGCFQADAAAQLRKQGARHCTYLRSPIADVCGSAWSELRRAMPKGDRPRILLGPSTLTTTATSAGIRLFAREILPRLENELGPEGFEVHVVGEGEPPPELARMLPRPSIKLRGRVEPADEEFLAADIQLVPTPFVLGIRLRIVAGFSFGCCVVAHNSESVNVPEMAHEQNSLLASDGPGLAAAIVRAIRDPALRDRLRTNARQTYESCFSPEAAAKPIVEELERLATERRRRPVA
jgi:glycosyltransferase involved in cell wall biosynthesis